MIMGYYSGQVKTFSILIKSTFMITAFLLFFCALLPTSLQAASSPWQPEYGRLRSITEVSETYEELGSDDDLSDMATPPRGIHHSCHHLHAHNNPRQLSMEQTDNSEADTLDNVVDNDPSCSKQCCCSCLGAGLCCVGIIGIGEALWCLIKALYC